MNPQQFQRYKRQMLIANWGEKGQKKLSNSKVFIAGVGGLGSFVSILLSCAGIGRMILVDNGYVKVENLNRQILYSENEVGLKKVNEAKKYLTSLNPAVEIETYFETIRDDNVDYYVKKSDIILDCLDNFETRLILNKSAIKNNVPLVHASVYGMWGQITFILPRKTPCLNCIFSTSNKKEVFPIVATTCGIIGSLQVNETIKFITKIGTNLTNKILFYDGESLTFDIIKISRTPNCPVCGKHK